MTSIFGTDPPTVDRIDTDTGPLQLMVAVSVTVPCVITQVRYYVASTALATAVSGSLPYQVWRDSEPDSVVTGTMTVPGTVGWITGTLSTPLQIPAGRRVAVAVSLPATSPLPYGSTNTVFPLSSALMTAHGSWYDYDASTLVVTDPRAATTRALRATNYLIDLEVAVSEMVNLDPGDMLVGDTLLVRRNIRGDVTAITPITDAYTVAMDVTGGPLDGTNVDVWVPDTTAGLASADMVLLKEVADPAVPSLHDNTADGSVWCYNGGGIYTCVVDGTTWRKDAKTTRVNTPTLVPH
jgi:hypothetical protein